MSFVPSGTVYAVLLNHREAVTALGDAMHAGPYDGPPVAPVLYLRPANTWSAHGDAVALPAGVDAVDVEPTIGVVFERATHGVSRDAALDHVGGFVVVADLTESHSSLHRPAIRQRDRDGFCVFAAVDAPATRDTIDVVVTVDGEHAARSSTRDLVRDIPDLIADVSAFVRFDAGDVLLVGAVGPPVRVRAGAAVRVDAGAVGSVSFAIDTVPETAPAVDVAPRATRRSSPLRRGRIAWEGAVHEVTEADGRVRLPDGRLIDETAPVWLPPLAPASRARSVFALGLNYADHAKELAFAPPAEPLVFMKGESSFVGHRGATPRPRDATFMHYECELAVVIGRTARGVRRDDAYDFVAGYTVANDYAIRDYLENWYRPNLKVKGRAATTPIGPWLVDAALVDDPMALSLTTRVDGVTTQRGTTGDMIFDVPYLIEYLSGFLTLSPGDVILTGTPEGLVDTPVGCVVETGIEGLGTLVSTIVEGRA